MQEADSKSQVIILGCACFSPVLCISWIVMKNTRVKYHFDTIYIKQISIVGVGYFSLFVI
jgi:hypothetical protein